MKLVCQFILKKAAPNNICDNYESISRISYFMITLNLII